MSTAKPALRDLGHKRPLVGRYIHAIDGKEDRQRGTISGSAASPKDAATIAYSCERDVEKTPESSVQIAAG